MKYSLLLALFLCTKLLNASEDPLFWSCRLLEHSHIPAINLSEHSPFYDVYDYAISHNKHLVALFQRFGEKKLATIKLWDIQTGKLIRSLRIPNYDAINPGDKIFFSPNDQFIYIDNAPYIKERKTSGLPIWWFNENEFILSSCITGTEGPHAIILNTAKSLAYVKAAEATESLCGVRNQKLYFRMEPDNAIFDSLYDPVNQHFFIAADQNYKNFFAEANQPQYSTTWASKELANRDKYQLFINQSQPYLLTLKFAENGVHWELWDYTKRQKVHQTFIQDAALSAPFRYNVEMYIYPEQDKVIIIRDNLLIVLDLYSAQILWKVKAPIDVSAYHFKFKDDHIVILRNSLLEAHNAHTGKILWKAKLPAVKKSSDYRAVSMPRQTKASIDNLNSYRNRVKSHLPSQSHIVIAKHTNGIDSIMLFDWYTGKKKQQFNIPYTVHGKTSAPDYFLSPIDHYLFARHRGEKRVDFTRIYNLKTNKYYKPTSGTIENLTQDMKLFVKLHPQGKYTEVCSVN